MNGPGNGWSAIFTAVAVAFVWVAVIVPETITTATALTAVRLPIEALVLLAAILAIPDRAQRQRTAVAVTVGALLGILTILRLLDAGFHEALGRPFNPVVDWGNVASGASLLVDAIGRGAATGVMAAAVVLVLAILALMPLAVLRITRIASARRRGVIRVATALLAAWLVLTVADVRVGGSKVASAAVASYGWAELSSIPAGLRDQHEFARATAEDPLNSTPTDELLAALRGKDVLFVFVESYGRVALEDPQLSGGIQALLEGENSKLRANGFSSRSAFLTSSTFGGSSWLAHSTFQSGLWVDSKQRYDVLMASDRLTLSHAFARAGWRTVVDVPANTADWSRRSFYHWDQLYDSRNVGYAGPRFGYPTIPDQYTLEALHRLELEAGDRQPVMAEIDLVSSHAPWSPLPQLVDPGTTGDGSVYASMPQPPVPSGVEATRAAYVASIEYSLGSVFSFAESYADEDTVLVFMGDHQPATTVAGAGSGNDVPITVIAKDPAVTEQISGWGWEHGVKPGADAPVWRMDAFRDRFLAAFNS